jgi:hypothetical protein
VTARLAVAALAVAALAAVPVKRSGPELALSGARGAIELSTSRPHAAILEVSDLRPGDTATGSVRVTNSGSAGARLRLAGSEPVDRPGSGGGRLSERLSLAIDEPGTAKEPVAVGPRAGCHDLGVLAAGESRSFRFTVRFSRQAGNAYAGASTTLTERWMAAAGDGCEPVGRREVRAGQESGGSGGAGGRVSGGGGDASGGHRAPGDSLPFTGAHLALTLAIALMLTTLGTALRRRMRSRP